MYSLLEFPSSTLTSTPEVVKPEVIYQSYDTAVSEGKSTLLEVQDQRDGHISSREGISNKTILSYGE